MGYWMVKTSDVAEVDYKAQDLELMVLPLTVDDFCIKKELTALLCDCVDSGASVGFIGPFSQRESQEYWYGVEADITKGTRYLLVANLSGKLVGSVQLSVSDKANGLHRAEIEKLMVHTQARGRGVAKLLMQEAEVLASTLCRSLLVLDTKKGDIAEGMYSKLGYVKVGEIPGFALSSSGELDATVLFYKELVCKDSGL